jgi:hypothetical protein
MFRFSDAVNYWRFGLPSTGEGWTLQKLVAGSVTTLAYGLSTFTAGDIAGVRCSGNNLTPFVNGRQVCQTLTDSFNASATLFGMQTSKTTTRFDDIYARSLSGGE